MNIKNVYVFAVLRVTVCGALFAAGLAAPPATADAAGRRWTERKAAGWLKTRGWLTGVNYIVSDAVNSIEMFDRTSYNPELIDRELALAEGLGFNCIRVLIPYALYDDDAGYLLKTFDHFLSICEKHKITVMPVLFDDCTFGYDTITVGRQPEPVIGWYSSRWSPSPGKALAEDESARPKLEKYVKALLKRFKKDRRIAVWDLYNEPLQSGVKSFALVQKVWEWAREVNPSQPLTMGAYNGEKELNQFIADNADVITYHCYGDKNKMAAEIERWETFNRPVLCTEWLNRPRKSLIPDIMPMLKERRVGSFMWGLVNGKTQTHLPWGHRPEKLPYTGAWQHDLYRGDFEPYDGKELEIIRELCLSAVKNRP
jgi:hypothetical protein